MKQMMILSIANTGLAVVKQNPVGYSLIAAETIKTRPRDETGKRLALIDDVINATLDAWNITGIAIERVFHNYNVTSSLTTGAVIGILQFIAHHRGVPVYQFTPQQVKKASVLGATIDKDTAKWVASRLFGTPIKSHYEADAVLWLPTGKDGSAMMGDVFFHDRRKKFCERESKIPLYNGRRIGFLAMKIPVVAYIFV